MNIIVEAHSDVGIRKKTNQDAYLVKVADTDTGRICLTVLCDGMGGLSDGEIASATVIRSFEEWFLKKLPEMLENGFSVGKLKEQWDKIIQNDNVRLSSYAASHGCRMGTTAVACLVFNDSYYIINVGDSRAYMIDDQVRQITKDQSLVQYQIDQGMLPPEAIETHPQRNVLLQCVGASEVVIPDFYMGKIEKNNIIMLCSDGFRHKISDQEIYERLSPAAAENEQQIKKQLIYLTELDKQRLENDNITAVIVKVC